MRLLSIVNKPQLRGAEIFARGLNRELEARGHSACLVALYEGEGLILEEGDLPLGGQERHTAEKVPGFQPRLLARLRDAVRSFNPDIVQVNGSRTVKYGALLRRLERRARWVLVYRSIGNPLDWQPNPLRRRLYARWVVSRMDGIVAVSQATLEALEAAYGLRQPAVHIPRGVDPQALSPQATRQELRARLGTPANRPVLLYVGSLSYEKRPDRLLRVAEELQRRGLEVELWIVGEGPLRPGLEDEARRRLGAPPARFFGLQADVATYLNAADVLILTSDTEGLPGVILEAGCLALPAVAPRVGGVGECVLDGETGCLVGPGDEAGLAAAAYGLLTDPGRRRRLGQAARHRVEECFTLHAIARRYLDFYRHLQGNRRR